MLNLAEKGAGEMGFLQTKIESFKAAAKRKDCWNMESSSVASSQAARTKRKQPINNIEQICSDPLTYFRTGLQ